MDHRRTNDVFGGEYMGLGMALLRAGLWLVSVPYALAMRLRRWAYRRGVLPSHRVESGPATAASGAARRPVVISIGNITTGGTGKTPMVAYVAGYLRSLGRRPAVVLRGYKSVSGVSDEAELLRMLCNRPAGPADAQAHAVEVIVSPNRLEGARRAVEAGADAIVLDDGFQHLRLCRDLDIVLIDATNPFGFGHCLPRGLLREPAASLAYADAMVITRVDCLDEGTTPRRRMEQLRRRLNELAPRATLHEALHRPVKVIDDAANELDPQSIAGQEFFAFCGVGNPRGFFHTLSELGVQVPGRRELPDHCPYTPAVLEDLRQQARQYGCSRLITTQKDYMRLAAAGASVGVWQLAVEIDVRENAADLLAKIRLALRATPPASDVP